MMIEAKRRQDWIRGRREKRKLARQARLRRQILRYLLLGVLLAAGFASLAIVPWSICDIDRDIVVRGNGVVSVDQVRGVLASCANKPIYRLDPKQLEQQVRSLEAVRYAFVRRHLVPRPHLVVYVLEEFPWASLADGPAQHPQYVISQSGRLIPVSDFPLIAQPPFTIYGTPAIRLTQKQVGQWASWVAYVQAQTGMPVDYVDMRHSDDMRMKTGDLYLKIGSPDSTLTRRLARLASILPSLAEMRGRLEYVDLSLDNNIPLKLAKVTDKSQAAESEARHSIAASNPLAATSAETAPDPEPL